MTSIIRSVINGYNWLLHEAADPRTQKYFLIESPWPGIALLIAYNYFVLKWGPEMMRDRKPFKIDRLIQVYNLAQVAACLSIFITGVMDCYGPYGKFNFFCEPVDQADNEFNRKISKYFWFYFMLKVIDLLDTVFFVLRKKNSQITGLHVYHHTGMVLVGWGATKYIPGGQSVFIGIINCFVHAIMYTYYFLTNYDAKYKQNLWWKKYITQLQIFQFLCIILHFGQILVLPSCGFPSWPVYTFLPHNFIILYLFGRFYQKAYLSKDKKT